MPLFRQQANSTSPLAEALQGLDRVKVFACADSVNANSPEHRAAVLDYAQALGVTVLLRTGGEYESLVRAQGHYSLARIP